MTYLVNDVFHTIQGEGTWTGSAAVFCRFSRCNLWTGLEKDRGRAVCQFCDTDFVKADKYTLTELVARIRCLWGSAAAPMVVFTGGEPFLQVDSQLTSELGKFGYFIAAETNGTQHRPEGIHWLCVSPKAGTTLHPSCTEGDELKLVYPQVGAEPELFEHLEFGTFWLSPMDGPNLTENTAKAVEYVLEHPQWRLNIQTHKVIGIP